MISSLQRLLCPAVLLAALVLFGARASGTIVGGEFYLGADPGEGNGDALSLAEGSSLAACFEEATISLAGLDPGIYDVGVRVQDDEDRWSTAIIRRFTLVAGDFELAGGLDRDGPASQGQTATSGAGAFGAGVIGEYFVGADPGEGNGDALSLAEGSSLAACFEEATISLAGLDPGIYDVGVRVQDDEDRWSTAIIRRFTLVAGDFELAGGLDRDGPASQGQTATSGAGAFGAGVIGEYFVGADPGEGNGDALSLAEGSSLAACFEEATISLAGLDPGIYDVGVRVQDDEDRWSTAIIRRFTLVAGDFELAGGLDRDGPANQPAETLLADRVEQQWLLTLPAVLESREYFLQIGDLLVPLEVGEFEEREIVLGRLYANLLSSEYVTSRMELLTISGETLSLTFLEPGRHSASWVSSEDFVVSLEQSGSIGAAAARIVEAEYFLTVAPLPGEGIPVPIEGDGSDTVESISALVLDITSLKAGTHAVGIRFRNAEGYWGNPVWRRFTSFSLFGDLDLEPPVLTLNGAASLEVGLGSEFADPGASALDAEDGDLSDQVVLRALPDTTLPGEQVIEYAVADRAGNVGTIQRTVVVTAQPVTTVSLTVAGPLTNGAVNGNQQTYPLGQQATLTAVADTGYLFTGWTGDASGTDNPLSLLMDGDRTVGATFAQDDGDPDQDGLSNYQELLVHGTDPNDPDSDGDGVADNVELANQTDPNDAADYNVFSRGLVAYYPFNGNADDESGNGNDGTVNGATPAPDRNGDTESAYSFDGTDDFINAGNLLPAIGNASMCAWFKSEAKTGHVNLIQKRRGPNGDGFVIQIYEGRIGCVLNRGDSVVQESTEISIVDGIWHHVIASTDSEAVKLYLDGELIQTQPLVEGILASNEEVWIGRGFEQIVAGGNRAFNGQIDDVRIYNRALSEEEVSELYELEKSELDPDTDSDGMPDDWERTHGLVVGIDDSELDLDGDKTPNLLEWLAGTDPNDQSSTFRPLGTHDGTKYHLSVPTITGRSYKISISLNLKDWLPYGTLNGDDTSQVWTFVETTVPDGPFHSHQHPYRYFFRIEISILNP